MKSCYLMLVFVFSSVLGISAQGVETYFVNSIPIDSLNAHYIEANVCNKPLSRMMYLYINYGQEKKLISRQNERLTNSKGEFVEFNSNVAALNYLDAVGFEVVSSSQGTDVSFTYILKRKSKD